MNPLLQFDFANNQQAILFKNPRDIISALSIEEVIPALQKVQEAVNSGFYAAGYISYEASPAFNHNFRVKPNHLMPLLWFGIFDNPHDEPLKSSRAFQTTEWIPTTNVDRFNSSIAKIKNYIEQGDTRQVNYTLRMQSHFSGDTISYYNQLQKLGSANYAAYLDTGDFTILSASPELFFHLKDGKITSKPMKGTIGRGINEEEDRTNAQWLYHSEKNRTENAMIVDLMKDELGAIANPGTVEVPHLFTIEKYPTVYQMTSTVTAEIAANLGIADIFKALFPCGSITGAPKVSTMNIIDELEDSPREVYCGAIGYITPDQEAIFNVPIRTVLIDNENNRAQYGVGGGITRDSTDKEEYGEVLTKTKVLHVRHDEFQLLESLGLREGKYLVLENHLKRLQQSAAYFRFEINLKSIREKLLDFAEKHIDRQWKVRLLVNKDGSINMEGKVTQPFQHSMEVALANTSIDKEDIFLYHKTTNRTVYENRLEQHQDVFDVLLWNQDHEITEFTMGNVVVEMNNKLYTPPVACGLLAGTFREALLKDGSLTERRVMLDELDSCSRLWLINSVREWVPVQFRK
ncbi:aminodeoxychorismate synthase component I [Virgibacillus profundi]|uniref:aminodeoxychorismate synthase component I n=1 Tax=Virgibacillus profundi TaxID=2024555 RepID=UPI002684B0B2